MTAADRLRGDVEALAGGIGERNVWRPRALAAAEAYVAGRLGGFGWPVRRQVFSAEGVEVANLEAAVPGADPSAPQLVVGAHYDTRCAMTTPRGRVRVPGAPGTPGANDNASGVAALLEIARVLAGSPPARTVRLVAYANEEPPFFQTGLMGSLVHARACRAEGIPLAGMATPETLGFYTDEPGSQRYPFPLRPFYPSAGNFVAFLSDTGSRRFARAALRAFRRRTGFPALAFAVPAVARRIGWSDDWAYWQVGCPAFALTDTAYLRYRHYHTTGDTPEKLDYARMAEVVTAFAGVVCGW